MEWLLFGWIPDVRDFLIVATGLGVMAIVPLVITLGLLELIGWLRAAEKIFNLALGVLVSCICLPIVSFGIIMLYVFIVGGLVGSL